MLFSLFSGFTIASFSFDNTIYFNYKFANIQMVLTYGIVCIYNYNGKQLKLKQKCKVYARKATVQSRIHTISLKWARQANALFFERICINGTSACITWAGMSFDASAHSIPFALYFSKKRWLRLFQPSFHVVYLKTSCPLEINNSQIT